MSSILFLEELTFHTMTGFPRGLSNTLVQISLFKQRGSEVTNKMIDF